VEMLQSYESNSFLSLKQLYRRQYCHYSAQVSSLFIHFSKTVNPSHFSSSFVLVW